jgi:hypothetical protein
MNYGALSVRKMVRYVFPDFKNLLALKVAISIYMIILSAAALSFFNTKEISPFNYH